MTMIDEEIRKMLAIDWVQEQEEKIAKQQQTGGGGGGGGVYSVKAWIGYLDVIDEHILLLVDPTTGTATATDDDDSSGLITFRDWVGRRAVSHLPRSYKLWKLHWDFLLMQQKRHQRPTTKCTQHRQIVACFERAIWTLSKYPRMWMSYLEYLLVQHMPESTDSGCINDCTFVRRTINRALQSVSVAQHPKLWKVILDPLLQQQQQQPEAEAALPVETTNQLLQRYCILQPEFRETYAGWCEKNGKFGQAAVAYQDLLNESSGHDNDSYWQSFCEILARHSEHVEQVGIDWEAILKTAIQQQIAAAASASSSNSGATEQTEGASVSQQQNRRKGMLLGLLYSWLASAWVQRGSFDMARLYYEEGLRTVRNVQDFSILYNSYLQLEEGLLNAITESMDDDDEEKEREETSSETKGDWDLLLPSDANKNDGQNENVNNSATSKLADMELAIARAENLTKRRPLLLNAVRIRQDKLNCEHWIERANLYVENEQVRQAVATLDEAFQTVTKASTSTPISQLVIRLVQIHEEQTDTAAARNVLDRVCRENATHMQKMEELAECWATWIELELKYEAWDEALSLSRQSVARRPLSNSLRLWDLRLDLEESLGTVQTTKDAYNRALETQVATVQHILNFGEFLTEHKYFEECLQAYERGLEHFAFPHAGAKLLWKAYLDAFLKRYKGTKTERARNLFERCLENCPAEVCAEFYMMNGEFEEEYGLTKRALSVYQAMCDKVPGTEKYTAYQLFVAKTTKYLGIAATRDIYQEAIEKLKNDPVSAVKICGDFARMETSLNETERARAIYGYGAQSADPRRLPEYWKDWNDFEIANGNEETFREMLRVKRSVEAAFSTVNYNATGMQEKVKTFSNEEAMRMIASNEGMDMDDNPQTKTAVSGFVPSTSSSKRTAAAASLDDVEERVAKLRRATAAAATGTSGAAEAADDDDEDEIDIDDIDAEIEEAAAEGAAKEAEEEEVEKQKPMPKQVKDVATKVIPDAVFGGLAAQKAK